MKNLEKPSKEVTTQSVTIHESKTFPFRIIETTDEKGKFYQIAIGQSIMSTKHFKTKFGTEMYIKMKSWDLITNVIGLTIELAKQKKV